MPPLPTDHAHQVAAFVLAAVQKQAGTRWNQGPRQVPFEVYSQCNEALSIIGQRRLFGVSEPAAFAICAWHRGERPVHLISRIPSAREMLRVQARGERYVSMLPDHEAAAHGDPRHPDGLSFALHDLCHLEKFVDPEHHAGQVGFFVSLDQALSKAGWLDLEAGFDSRWHADRDYVFADMNGSALFLFAALKMKLKMAVRRQVAASEGLVQPERGPLTPLERAAYEPRRDLLLSLLGMPDDVASAGREVSARRCEPQAAAKLLAWFTGVLQRSPDSV